MAAAIPSIERAAPGAKVTGALEFLRKSPTKLLIGGKWVPSQSGKTFETINPANEEVLALVAEGDRADVDEAVKAARKAFEEGKWPMMSPHQRSRYLLKLAELVDKYADELAELESLDNGKPVLASALNRYQRRGRSASLFRRMADQDLRRNQSVRSRYLQLYLARACGGSVV